MDLSALSNVSAFVHSRGRKLSLLKTVWWDQHGCHWLVTSVDSWAAWRFHDQALQQLKFLILSHSGFKAVMEGKLFRIHPFILMWYRKISCMQREDGKRPSKWAFPAVAKAINVDERGAIHFLMSWKLLVPECAPSPEVCQEQLKWFDTFHLIFPREGTVWARCLWVLQRKEVFCSGDMGMPHWLYLDDHMNREKFYKVP